MRKRETVHNAMTTKQPRNPRAVPANAEETKSPNETSSSPSSASSPTSSSARISARERALPSSPTTCSGVLAMRFEARLSPGASTWLEGRLEGRLEGTGTLRKESEDEAHSLATASGSESTGGVGP